MPSTTVASGSQLFGSAGWISADQVDDQQILGVDRHGRLSSATVRITLQGTERCCWLGSPTSFGCFVQQSRLLTASGNRVTLGNLIESGVKGHSFEVCTPQELGHNAPFAPALRPMILAKEGDTDLIPFRSKPGCLFEFRMGSAGASIEDLMSVAETRRISADEWQFERSEHGFLSWLILHFRLSGVAYNLSYDRLQHTTQVTLRRQDGVCAPDLRASCLFKSPDETQKVSLRWDDPAWNPLSYGFILARD